MAFSYLKCTFFIHLLEEHRTLSKTSHEDAGCNIAIRKLLHSMNNILLVFIWCHWNIQIVNISAETIICCRFRLLYELPWYISKMAKSQPCYCHNYRRKKTHKKQSHSQQITLLFHLWLLITDGLLWFFFLFFFFVRQCLTHYLYTNMLLISWSNFNVSHSTVLSVLTNTTITPSSTALYL